MDDIESAARGNVEAHLGDVCEPDDDPNYIAEEVFVLAMDGALKAGANMERAREIGEMIAGEYR